MARRQVRQHLRPFLYRSSLDGSPTDTAICHLLSVARSTRYADRAHPCTEGHLGACVGAGSPASPRRRRPPRGAEACESVSPPARRVASTAKVEGLRADARWAEAAGLASVWIPQVPNEFDALTAAAVVGAVTTRIEIGTAVVPIQPRHPIALAQQALSVQAVVRRAPRARGSACRTTGSSRRCSGCRTSDRRR